MRVEFAARDANDQPVVAEGIVKLLREYWWEVWLTPDGREAVAAELCDLADVWRADLILATGGTGPISWSLSGALQPGLNGTVLFRVKVDP